MATLDTKLQDIKSIFQSLDFSRTGRISRFALAHTIKGVGFSDDEVVFILSQFGSEPVVEYDRFLDWVWEMPLVSQQQCSPSSSHTCHQVSAEIEVLSPVAAGHRGDPLRTLSVHYMTTTLVQEMSAQEQHLSAKVYEIEPTVIRPKGESIICPRDQRLGAAYCDCVHGLRSAGMAKIMLSYSWGYRLCDIVDTLVEYCNNKALDEESLYVWMCCFCINQHRVVEAQAKGITVPFEAFQAEFGGRVKSICRILAVMDCWESPAYVTRVWCVFELYSAVACRGCLFDIMMPPHKAKGFADAIADSKQGGRLDLLWRSLAAINVAEAQATYPSDRENIIKLIETDKNIGGLHALNKEVVKCLQAWFADSAEHHAHALLKESHDPSHKLNGGAVDAANQAAVSACTAAAHMLVQLGQPDRALLLLEGAREQLHASKQLETPLYACVLRHFGVISRRKGNMKEALAHYEKAKQLHEDHQALSTPEGAQLMTNLGNAMVQLGDLLPGLHILMQAESIARSTGWLDTNDGAMLLLSIGAVKRKQNRFEDALEMCSAAQDVLVRIDQFMTPAGAIVSKDVGFTLEGLGRFEEAIAYYSKALAIFEALGTMTTTPAADLYTKYGAVQARLGKVEEAKQNYVRAHAIFASMNMLETANAEGLLSKMEELHQRSSLE